MVHAYESSGQRWTRYALWIYVTLVLVFLMAPILIIVPLSFSAGSFLYFPLPGLSLRWYADFFTSDLWLPSLRNSLIVGTGATIVATLLGTLAAFGFWRARFAGRRLLFALLLSPQVVPLIIVAVGVYFAVAPLGLANGLLGLTLAHAALGAPFVLVTVLSTLSGFDRNLLDAAANLGAPPLLAFRRIALPIIFPGIFSGALFAFATSFDEVVVALLLTGPGQRTLPMQMFAGINQEISLTITAAGTLLVVLACLLLVTAEGLRRRSQRLRARPLD
ncbi:MAG TPA: ABC transporter permease [Burkholderiaceae bacterium]|nr:ABC transporter permease [Burkholderiaceae bacterium]